MQKRLSSVLAGVVLLSTIAGWMNAGEADKGAGLVGSWSATVDTNNFKLEFTNDGKFTFTQTRGDESGSYSGTYKIDTKAKPNTIDMTVTGGTSSMAKKFKGKVSLGIVNVEGDKLEWCANEPGKDVRPRTFAGNDGDDSIFLLMLDRIKK